MRENIYPILMALLNMSLTALPLVGVVLALRVPMRRVSPRLTGILWVFVGLRLCIPFSLKTPFSLLSSGRPITQTITRVYTPVLNTGIDALDEAVTPLLSQFTSESGSDFDFFTTNQGKATLVWAAGVCVLLAYAIISYILLRRRIAPSLCIRDNIFICDNIRTPFVAGTFWPEIYLPSTLPEEVVPHVLAHEQAHIQRKDHWWKLIGFLLLTLHWFNPLCWLCYVLFCRDIELACDRKVIQDLSTEEKQAYSNALLTCSSPMKHLSCPLSFAEVGVKSRIRAVLTWKKAAVGLVVLSVVLCVLTGFCLGTSPGLTYQERQAVEAALVDTISNGQLGYDSASGRYWVEKHCIYDIEKVGDTVTVYTCAVHQSFILKNGETTHSMYSNCSYAYTFQKVNDSYVCTDEWRPGDGSLLSDDLRAKYPLIAYLKQFVVDESTLFNIAKKEAEAYFQSL